MSNRGRLIVIVLCVIAGAFAAWPARGDDEDQTRYSVTEWLKLAWISGKPLLVTEIDGGIYVRPNTKTDEGRILIKGIKTAFAAGLVESRREARRLRISVEEPADKIEVKTVRPPWADPEIRGRVDYDLRVPPGIILRLGTVSGRIDTDGMKGPANAESVSGRIILSGIEGPVTAKSDSGDIEIHNCPETLQIISTSGRIVFETDKLTATELTIESKSGDIEVSIPDGLGATFAVRTVTGVIDTADSAVESAPGAEGASTYRSGDGAAKVSITTVGGNVKFTRPHQRRNTAGPVP